MASLRQKHAQQQKVVNKVKLFRRKGSGRSRGRGRGDGATRRGAAALILFKKSLDRRVSFPLLWGRGNTAGEAAFGLAALRCRMR